jgi:flagellin
MPIVVNTNSSATSASHNLSRANDSLRKSLERLSSGKRINDASDDAGGLAVAYKLNSRVSRTSAIIQNTQNALSYLQVQDGAMESIGKIASRMSELRVMAQDVTKNSSDVENYSKEFIELQSQLGQIKQEKFNGISLFAAGSQTIGNGGFRVAGGGTYTASSTSPVTYDKYTRTLLTSASGQSADGSISLNVINLEFVLSIGSLSGAGNASNVDLGGLGNATGGSGGTQLSSDGLITSILHVSVGQFSQVIEKIADMRAENGAEQNRVVQSLEMLQTNLTNIEAAYGRIVDTDIALESTRFARHNVLVQASAAMTAQANQLTNVALQLLG